MKNELVLQPTRTFLLFDSEGNQVNQLETNGYFR
jgi:hypothetical protein